MYIISIFTFISNVILNIFYGAHEDKVPRPVKVHAYGLWAPAAGCGTAPPPSVDGDHLQGPIFILHLCSKPALVSPLKTFQRPESSAFLLCQHGPLSMHSGVCAVVTAVV